MPLNYPSTGAVFIIVWFAVSILIEVIGTFVFWIWLRKRGLKLVFGLTGTPGYMEYTYLKWCRSQLRRPNTGMLVFRAVSLINVIIAGIFFILLVTTR